MGSKNLSHLHQEQDKKGGGGGRWWWRRRRRKRRRSWNFTSLNYYFIPWWKEANFLKWHDTNATEMHIIRVSFCTFA